MSTLHVVRGALHTELVAVADRFAFALEEARRALDQQQADLNSLRDRAGNLLQFGGLAAGFIGALTLRGDAKATGWTYFGALVFFVLGVLVIAVLWPRYFTFTNDATVMLDDDLWDREPDEIAEHLARYLVKHNDRNAKVIGRMMKCYTAAVIAFLAEMVVLLVDLLGR